MRNIVLVSILLAGCATGTVPVGENPPTENPPTGNPPGSAAGQVDVGDCESSTTTYRASSEAPPAPVVEVDADRRIVVTFEDRPANCCADPRAWFSNDGTDIDLSFDPEDFGSTSSGCDCYCTFDFTVTSEPYESGEYVLFVIYDGSDEGTFDVVVP
jgi:hypothetical protein